METQQGEQFDRENTYGWLDLEDDEEILWEGEPELISIAGTAFYALTIIGIVVPLFAYLGIKNRDYVITNKRIYRKEGILSESVKNTELTRVQDANYEQSAIGNMLGFGTVSFSTAGGGGDELQFTNISEPGEIQQLVNEKKEEMSSGRHRSSSDSTGSSSQEAQSEIDEQLNEVVDELQKTRKALKEVNDNMD